jgi:hypothetical protein
MAVRELAAGEAKYDELERSALLEVSRPLAVSAEISAGPKSVPGIDVEVGLASMMDMYFSTCASAAANVVVVEAWSLASQAFWQDLESLYEGLPFSHTCQTVAHSRSAQAAPWYDHPSQDACLGELCNFPFHYGGGGTQRLNVCYGHKRRQPSAEIQHLCDPGGIHAGLVGHLAEHAVADVVHVLWDVTKVKISSERGYYARIIERAVIIISWVRVFVGQRSLLGPGV